MSEHQMVLATAALLIPAAGGLAQVFNVNQGIDYPNFQAAVDAAAANDVLEVRADVVLPSGTNFGFLSGIPLTIQGDVPTRKVTAGSAYNWGAAILPVGGAITFKDLVLDGGAFPNAMIRAVGSNVTLQNVTMTNAFVGLQPGAANGAHIIDNSTITASDAGIQFIADPDQSVTLQNGSVLLNCNTGVQINAGLARCSLVVDASSIVGGAARGIQVEGNDALIVLQNGSMMKDKAGSGIVEELAAFDTTIEARDSVFDNNGPWHILVGDGGGGEKDLILERVTFWGGASGSNPLSALDAMTATITHCIFANWGAGGAGINACCGFAGTIDNCVMVNDNLILANVDPLVPDTVLTSTVFPVIKTNAVGDVFSVFLDTNPASPDFLTINADPKGGDPRIAAAHLIDDVNNAGAKPVGGFVGTSSVQDWNLF